MILKTLHTIIIASLLTAVLGDSLCAFDSTDGSCNLPTGNGPLETSTVLPSTFHAIIIGGSAAGLSAALTLGRSLRDVLVIDGADPCNARTPHSHNFLTRDGTPPLEVRAIAIEQVAKYKTVHFVTDMAIQAIKNDDSTFRIVTKAGRTFTGKKLLMATGVKDIMLPIPGFMEVWGISAIHCPYCHGYEYKGQKTAIMANAEIAIHLAGMVKNLTPDVTLLTNGTAMGLTEEQKAKLARHSIRVIEQPVAEIIHTTGGLMSAIKFEDGSVESFSAAYVRLPFEHHSDIHAQLGLKIAYAGYAKGLIQVDEMYKTSLVGVFAAGDCCSPMRSIANAVAAGSFAGAAINSELLAETFT